MDTFHVHQFDQAQAEALARLRGARQFILFTSKDLYDPADHDSWLALSSQGMRFAQDWLALVALDTLRLHASMSRDEEADL